MTQTIWVVDDDQSIRWVLERALRRAGYEVQLYSSCNEANGALATRRPAMLFCDVRLPDGSGLDVIRNAQHRHPGLPAVVMTAYSDFQTTVAAFEAGAVEHLPKPFDVDDLLALTRRTLEREFGDSPARTAGAEASLLGDAPAMQPVFRAIGRLARTAAPVLITGESGTGKELVARALHQHSPRRSHAFVAINTAAIPGELLESELFGHERGAFTGAHQRRPGRFEQADGGTLFLDEIGDMPPGMQTRLLRVLAEGEFYRVGGHEPVRVDVRIIAATHQNLESAVGEGRFREDLYHRLNVVHVAMPPLRRRPEDIPLLAARFLEDAAEEFGVAPKRLTDRALEQLRHRPWPGNVRELRNLCRRLTVMVPGRDIGLADLPEAENESTTAESWQAGLRQQIREQLAASAAGELAPRTLQTVERILLEEALIVTDGHRQQAAARLGWGRNTVTRKLQEYGID